ncbi:MAG: transcriptional repressor [Spirochaetes bacterium]|nr:transcriptional repressor [Spirochaetota bacterium]
MRTSSKNPLTAHRARVLAAVDHVTVPVNAEAVYSLVKRSINKATVYRALQFLAKTNRIAEFVSDCPETGMLRYYYPLREPHTHFFHCTNCHTFIPFDGCTLSGAIRDFEKSNGLSVTAHTLALSGTCGACTSVKRI